MNQWLVADSPLVIGHRGASAAAPENTLAAFRLAQAQGADGIEFDVWLSADNVPVVIHDATLERTTDGVGLVSERTVAELQAVDAGNGETIPTLDQVFETLGRDFLYNVEIKHYGWRANGVEAIIADHIRAHNLASQVTVSSFSFIALRRARRSMPPGVLLALLRAPEHSTARRLFFQGQAEHPHYSMVDAAYMAWARRTGHRVHVWTVDDSAETQRLTSLGVHAIITNTPGFIRQTLLQR